MPIWWMWVNAGFLRISDALVLRAMAFPMHDCMGFHMLRVSDPRLL